MKKISVIVPCFNEEDNVVAISEAIIAEFAKLPRYDYEILFIDNDSQDHTRLLIRGLCAENPKIRAIFNAKNFGQFNSPFYGLISCTGDAGILMAADFQDPPTLIPEFVKGWEEGYKIVSAIKTKSKENPLMYAMRGLYYKLIKKFSSVDQIEQFTGYALYDRDFIEVLKQLDDPTPFLRGIVAELGFRRKDIPFTQPLRRAGKTSNNLAKLFDAAMLSFTTYTTAGLRACTVLGMVMSLTCLVVSVVYLIMKLTNWYGFQAGMAPMVIGMFLLGGLQLFFIGLIGEYIMSINNRVKHRPLVVEEERINFGENRGRGADKNQSRNPKDARAKERPMQEGRRQDRPAAPANAQPVPKKETAPSQPRQPQTSAKADNRAKDKAQGQPGMKPAKSADAAVMKQTVSQKQTKAAARDGRDMKDSKGKEPKDQRESKEVQQPQQARPKNRFEDRKGPRRAATDVEPNDVDQIDDYANVYEAYKKERSSRTEVAKAKSYDELKAQKKEGREKRARGEFYSDYYAYDENPLQEEKAPKKPENGPVALFGEDTGKGLTIEVEETTSTRTQEAKPQEPAVEKDAAAEKEQNMPEAEKMPEASEKTDKAPEVTEPVDAAKQESAEKTEASSEQGN